MGFGIRLTPTLPGGRKTAIVLQFLTCLAYIIYMTIAGPFLIFHRLEGYKLLILVFFQHLCSVLILPSRARNGHSGSGQRGVEEGPHI